MKKIGIGIAVAVAAALILVLLAHAPVARSAALRYALAARPAQLRTHPPGRSSRLQPGHAARWPGRAARVGRGLAGRAVLRRLTTSRSSLPAGILARQRRVQGHQRHQRPRLRPSACRRHAATFRNPKTVPATIRRRCGSIASTCRASRLTCATSRRTWRFEAPAIGFELTPDQGSIALAQPAELRFGSRTTRISRLNGQAAFDGRALHLTATDVRTDDASMTVDGTVLLIARESRV